MFKCGYVHYEILNLVLCVYEVYLLWNKKYQHSKSNLKNTQLLIVKKIIIQIYFMRRGNHVYLYSDFRQEQIVRLQASWWRWRVRSTLSWPRTGWEHPHTGRNLSQGNLHYFCLKTNPNWKSVYQLFHIIILLKHT